MGRATLSSGRWISRLKAAALWHARAENHAPVKVSAEFRSWLADGGNKAAWDRVSGVLHVLDHHREAPELAQLRAAAWRRAHYVPSRRRSLWLFAVGAAAAVIVTFAGAAQYWRAPKPVIYTTEIGERRAVALADGSRVTLDSSSSVTVLQFSRHTRSLELTKGRAHFEVAHDATRPFSVKVGSETVLDIGTAFNVEQLRSKVLVTLMQGRVAVESNSTKAAIDSKTFLLVPGQELVVNRAGRSTIIPADLQAANAWEHGQIVFNGEPLGEAAERLNRYLGTPLKVDPEIAKTRISGVFAVSKLDAFVRVVTSYFPIQSKQENGYIVLEKRL